MSRRYNFMPSRFAVEASRHVTPSHSAASRTERDSGGTESGQPADNSVTPPAVPREIRGATNGVARVGLPLTGDSRVADPVLEAVVSILQSSTPEELAARREDRQRYFGGPSASEQARLDGRHGRTWWDVTDYMSMKHRTAAEIALIRAAFDEGVALRHRNVRCFCNQCLMPPELLERERKRWDYARRRTGELTAAGLAPAEIEKQVRDELERGMAL